MHCMARLASVQVPAPPMSLGELINPEVILHLRRFHYEFVSIDNNKNELASDSVTSLGIYHRFMYVFGCQMAL